MNVTNVTYVFIPNSYHIKGPEGWTKHRKQYHESCISSISVLSKRSNERFGKLAAKLLRRAKLLNSDSADQQNQSLPKFSVFKNTMPSMFASKWMDHNIVERKAVVDYCRWVPL